MFLSLFFVHFIPCAVLRYYFEIGTATIAVFFLSGEFEGQFSYVADLDTRHLPTSMQLTFVSLEKFSWYAIENEPRLLLKYSQNNEIEKEEESP